MLLHDAVAFTRISNMDTTGKAFVEHWTYASQKGLLKSNTANSLQVACRQVLSVEDGWEGLDVMKIDVDGLFKRFVNIKGRKFTPDSLQTYKRRFNQALGMFKDYVKNPEGWKPSTRERTTSAKGNGSGSDEAEPSKATKAIAPPIFEAGLVDYPYPLGGGRLARLRLPADLKLADVKRLYAFMKTLASDFEVPEA
jgi:hypothetical protein